MSRTREWEFLVRFRVQRPLWQSRLGVRARALCKAPSFCLKKLLRPPLVEMLPWEKGDLQSHSPDWVWRCVPPVKSPLQAGSWALCRNWRLSILPAEARPDVQSMWEWGTSVSPHRDWITVNHAGKAVVDSGLCSMSYLFAFLGNYWIKHQWWRWKDSQLPGTPRSLHTFTCRSAAGGVGRNLHLFHRLCSETKSTV